MFDTCSRTEAKICLRFRDTAVTLGQEFPFLNVLSTLNATYVQKGKIGLWHINQVSSMWDFKV